MWNQLVDRSVCFSDVFVAGAEKPMGFYKCIGFYKYINKLGEPMIWGFCLTSSSRKARTNTMLEILVIVCNVKVTNNNDLS